MSSRLPPSFCWLSFCAFLLCGLLPGGFLVVLAPSAFAQGLKQASADGSRQEKNKDTERPDLRDRWMMRGRSAPSGQSAGALRLRAYRRKLAMRAAQLG